MCSDYYRCVNNMEELTRNKKEISEDISFLDL